MTGPGDDTDRALVAAEIARCRKRAADAREEGDHAETLYADGIADLLELVDVHGGAAYVRDKALRALKGTPGGIPGRERPGAGPNILGDERWLATWWLTYRTRKAREALNRERARHGLPPVVRNLMARADDWD